MPLPQFDVDLVVEDMNPTLLRVIFEDDVLNEGIGDNRLYFPTDGMEWVEVSEILQEEDVVTRRIAEQSQDSDEFDRYADEFMNQQYGDGDLSEGPMAVLSALDLGVIAAVAALSASGCVTTTSCRGHTKRGEAHPIVRFATDEWRLPLLQRAARDVECGLTLDHEGMLQVYATNIGNLLNFARTLSDRRAEYERIESRVPIPRLDDDELNSLPTPRKRDLADALERWDVDLTVRHAGQMELFDD